MAKIYELDGIVPAIDPSAFVHPDAVVIGDVIIGAGCYIAPGAVLRGDFGRITIHAGANVQDNCVMHGFPGTGTLIEEDGHIGHGAVIHGAVIGRNALVGMNAVVNDEAVIGAESVVAAMAFVKAGDEFPARSLIVGIPAKRIRDVSDEDVAWKSDGTRDYQELARRCHASLKPATPLEAPEPNRPFMPLGASLPKHTKK
ncbi:MAG: phenylacetic acid degradation protein PaaY [Rhodospirillaceae bacterium]|jgi:phenylacetic acid degradation protein|nr:phenylacetic acid degradation protein PaaY [Rhodospirillaceae bacterium]